MEIKIKYLTETAKMPTCGSIYSAGSDLCADINTTVVIPPHTTVKIHTGIAIELPENTFGAMFARSGISTKRGLSLANGVGVIDSDYRGELIVALHNHSNDTQIVGPNERIAQLVIVPYIKAEFVSTETLSNSVRGEGGFGSTGAK